MPSWLLSFQEHRKKEKRRMTREKEREMDERKGRKGIIRLEEDCSFMDSFSFFSVHSSSLYLKCHCSNPLSLPILCSWRWITGQDRKRKRDSEREVESKGERMRKKSRRSQKEFVCTDNPHEVNWTLEGGRERKREESTFLFYLFFFSSCLKTNQVKRSLYFASNWSLRFFHSFFLSLTCLVSFCVQKDTL